VPLTREHVMTSEEFVAFLVHVHREGDHWVWHGPMVGEIPTWRGRRAAKLAFVSRRGEIPVYHRFVQACDHPACVNPSHWTVRAKEHRSAHTHRSAARSASRCAKRQPQISRVPPLSEEAAREAAISRRSTGELARAATHHEPTR
jgi:hypothetical protein